MKKIFFIIIFISSLNYASLSRDTVGVVSDSVSQLMWQDNVASVNMEWINALSYCENLSLNTFDDWRLPNKIELLSIVDYTQTSPAISTFIHTSLGYYWSATTSIHDRMEAWIISFKLGHSNKNNKNKSLYVRCVR